MNYTGESALVVLAVLVLAAPNSGTRGDHGSPPTNASVTVTWKNYPLGQESKNDQYSRRMQVFRNVFEDPPLELET